METLTCFLKIAIPLIIIMDPLGNLPLFLLFTEQNSPAEQNRMAAIAALAAGAILVFFSLTGDYILVFFNIGLPAFQIAGGLIFFIYALQMLQLLPGGLKTSAEEEQEGVAKDNVALVPLATPLLAGPGAITAVLVWRHSPDQRLNLAIVLMAIAAACLISYAVFRFGPRIRKILGVGGLRVLTRLMGLLLAVLAVQFMVAGFQNLNL